MTLVEVLDAITLERERQAKIGNDSNDKATPVNDFIAFATAYLGRAAEGVHRNVKEGNDPKQRLVQAAAILVAALEVHG